MKIVLAVEDERGRSSLLIADDGTVYTLAEVLDLVKKGQISGLQVASRNGVSYLRASRKRVGTPALQDVSVSRNSVLSISANTASVFSRTQFRPFWDFYQNQLDAQAQQGKLVISIDGQPHDTLVHVQATLLPYREYIFSAAQQFQIDPYLLAGIFIDETIRLAPFEEVRDKLIAESLPLNISIGIGQVKLETARGLIRGGYYNPNPSDENLSKERIAKTSSTYLYPYVVDQKNNVYFAAARIHSLMNDWKSKVNIDISPIIIATLYSLGDINPHLGPQSNPRGEQIANEFMPMARGILGMP